MTTAAMTTAAMTTAAMTTATVTTATVTTAAMSATPMAVVITFMATAFAVTLYAANAIGDDVIVAAVAARIIAQRTSFWAAADTAQRADLVIPVRSNESVISRPIAEHFTAIVGIPIKVPAPGHHANGGDLIVPMLANESLIAAYFFRFATEIRIAVDDHVAGRISGASRPKRC